MRNELVSGFYTLSDAANLIALDVVGMSAPALRRLFFPTRRYDVAVRSERAKSGHVRDISFLDLMELRFLSHFRKQGVSAQTLRKIASSMRELVGPHPFARKDILFRTDTRRVYAEIAERENDKRLLELLSRQYQLDVIEQSLKQGANWDLATQYIDCWRPRESDYPSIVLDPRRSSGQPSLAASGIAVDTLVDAWNAEEGDSDAVASWFEISSEDVREAVRFRSELPY